jgi:glycosyltransferase involved in cell wall biosynthesis
VRALIVSKAFVAAAYRRKLTELGRLGLDVVAVVPPSWREGEGKQELEPSEDDGYEMIVSPLWWNGHFHLHYYPRLPRILDRVRPDIIHVDEEPYNLATYLSVRAAARRGIPSLFFTWQNLLRRYPPPFRQMEARVYRTVRHALAGSEEAAQVLRAKGYAGELSIVPQFGVDPDVFQPGSLQERPFTVGFLNRLIPAKDPLMMLDAFTDLSSGSRLLMVGDGPLRGAVENAVREHGLGDRVTVKPRVPSGEIPELMRSLDVCVLPSRTTPTWKEQFGRVLIEAMATGVPVVASESGEIPNVVGHAGILVPEADRDALAAALLALYQDADLRKRLGTLGRQRVLERFTHERIARLTAEAYAAALS